MNQLYKQRPSSIKLILLLFVSLPYIGVGQAITTVQDFDGNTYPTALIGEQEWMAENLNVSKFRNGDPIPQATSDKEWLEAKKNKTPIWSYYDYNPDNGKKYGKLYNWYAVNDSRGLAPEGFIVPKNSHWKALAEYLASNDFEDYDLKSENGWHDNEGNNTSGFSAQASGYRYNDTTYFTDESEENQEFMPFAFANLEFQAYWWTSTEISKNTACAWKLEYEMEADDEWNIKTNGFAVRCIKDVDDGQNDYSEIFKKANGVKDIDGNFYETILINGQEWMAQNLRVSRYNDGTIMTNLIDNSEWASSIRFDSDKDGWCNYGNDKSNELVFGKIYNYNVVKNSKQACPIGWRITTQVDWEAVMNIFGSGGSDLFKSEGSVGNGDGLWEYENFSLNVSGLNCLPGGYRGSKGFESAGRTVHYWLYPDRSNTLTINGWNSYVQVGNGGQGCYIRCVKEVEKDIIELESEGPEEIIIETKPKSQTKQDNSNEEVKEIINSIKGIFRR